MVTMYLEHWIGLYREWEAGQEGEGIQVSTTTWVYDDYHCSWVCQNCKLEWSFDYDGPEENGVKYCPKCGCKITGFVGEGI